VKNFVSHIDEAKKGKNFLRELENNHILELPDFSNIKGYPIEFINDQISIEYSNKCIYKLITFHDLKAMSKSFKQAQYIVRFLKYLEDEFNY
jgi:hypothetical protein